VNSLLRKVALSAAASALVVGGLALPADAATHTAYISDTGYSGAKVTAKVTARDVNLTTLGAEVRVDVSTYTAGGDVTIDADNWVDISARSTWEWEYADLVQVADNRYQGKMILGPLSAPGVYDVGAYISATAETVDGTDYLYASDDTATTITVKRATQIRVAASPNPATVGRAVVVSGTLKKLGTLDGWTATYVPAAGARVGLFFDPAGDAPQVYKGSVTVSSQGTYSKTFTASGPGVWRAKFPGTTTTYLAPSGANVTLSTR
jgi:hypothetical protein